MLINTTLSIGSLVYVTSYSPFRGLRGIIRAVEKITDEVKGAYCFYQVEFDVMKNSEPIWFEADEVAAIVPLAALTSEISRNS